MAPTFPTWKGPAAHLSCRLGVAVVVVLALLVALDAPGLSTRPRRLAGGTRIGGHDRDRGSAPGPPEPDRRNSRPGFQRRRDPRKSRNGRSRQRAPGFGRVLRPTGVGLACCPKKGVIPTPEVASTKLQNIVNDLHKGTTNPGRVGTGTTAHRAQTLGTELRPLRPRVGRATARRREPPRSRRLCGDTRRTHSQRSRC